MDVSFEERLLATIPEEWEPVRGLQDQAVFFSPDGRSVAYLVQLTGEMDEKPRCFLVVDGKKHDEVGRVGQWRGCFPSPEVLFSAGVQRTAYVYRIGNYEVGREGVVIDGKQGPLFDEVTDPAFSPDGKRIAYTAQEKGRKFAVFDHEPVLDYDRSDAPRFSPNGRRIAFRGFTLGEPDEDGDRSVRSEFMVVDGVKGEEFDSVGWASFNADGKTVAYAAKKEDKYSLVGITPPIEGYDYLDDPVFSPDGKRWACVAGRDGRFFILLDGREVKSDFPSVADPLFSPDGKRLAFRGIRDTMELFGELPPIHKSDGRQCMVVDGEAGEDNQFIWKPHFSPDSRRLIYSMNQKEHWILVFGTEKFGKEFDQVGEPAVSPDGSRFAFVAEIEDGSMVVCGAQRSERFDDIYGAPVFSPDGTKLAFGVRKGRELWWKVMEVK